MATPAKSASSVAKAGVSLLKKLVYENHQDEPRERRAAERDDTMGEVLVKVIESPSQPAMEMKSFVRNVSPTGCGLWARQAISVGATVMVSGLAGKTQSMPQRLGRVRHCRGSAGTGFAIGVQFNSESK